MVREAVSIEQGWFIEHTPLDRGFTYLQRHQLFHDAFDLALAIHVAIDGLNDFSASVFPDDAVDFQLCFFDFFCGITRSYFYGLDCDFIAVLFFEIINYDRYFCAKGSSIQVVI